MKGFSLLSVAVSLLVAVLLMAGCGKSSATAGAGTFPNVLTAAAGLAPQFAASRAPVGEFSFVPGVRWPAGSRMPPTYDPLGNFPTYAAKNYLKDILAPTADATVTSAVKLQTVLTSVQGIVASINANFSDSSGAAANCASVAGKTIKTPFFS